MHPNEVPGGWYRNNWNLQERVESEECRVKIMK